MSLSKPQKDKNRTLAKIENLQLPKRMEKRRPIYLGENIKCMIGMKGSSSSFVVDMVDISLNGIGIVDANVVSISPADLQVGKKVVLSFANESQLFFKVEGAINNLTHVKFAGHDYSRIGIQFSHPPCATLEEYEKKLPKLMFQCKAAIHPQAWCEDPFFFSEVILFYIQGISSKGLDLQVSARSKTLLPNQILVLECYIAGRGSFKVKVKISGLIYALTTGKNGYRIWAEFMEPPKEFLHALSEYLVMFNADASPNFLRQNDYQVGNLNNSIQMSYAKISANIIEQNELRPSLIACPINFLDPQFNSRQHARNLTCKVGMHLASISSLVFVEPHTIHSVFSKIGHTIPENIQKNLYVELVDFYISKNVVLVDFLLSFLKHVVRIANQSQAEYLLVESTKEMLPVLQKLGFEDVGSKTKRLNKNLASSSLYLLSLSVKKVVRNDGKQMSVKLWEKIYKDLHVYLQNKKLLYR